MCQRELRPILLHKELGDKEKQIKMIDDSKKLSDTKKEELKKTLDEIHSKFENKYPKDENGNSVYPHIISGPYILEDVDFELIDLILGKLGDKEKKNLRTNINKKEISKHGATFLADVITVGCALLIDNPTVWKDYDITFDKNKTKTKEY